LEYRLQDHATIPPDQGVFLPTTWRMHENVCRFISDAVYDGRLHPEPDNQNQSLILNRHGCGRRLVAQPSRKGQEAEVVLISMVTSSDEDLPRNIEFGGLLRYYHQEAA
jgi:superfamily I DNA and/or RNA helicase